MRVKKFTSASTAILLILLLSGLATLTPTIVAHGSELSPSCQRLSLGMITPGTISGDNLEDYYTIEFGPGFYNITLTDDVDGLDLNVYRVAGGRLTDVGIVAYLGTSHQVFLGFLPSINLPTDSLYASYGDYTFSLYDNGMSKVAPSEYEGMLMMSGLSFVYPPSGAYVIKVSWNGDDMNDLPEAYGLLVTQVYGVTVLTEGVKGDVLNLRSDYPSAGHDWNAIFRFSPDATDLYLVNATWNVPGAYISIMVTNENGLVTANLGTTGGQEHMYTVMRSDFDYYVTLTCMSGGPTNASVTVTGLNAEKLSAGQTIVGDFPGTHESRDVLYMLDYEVGYVYDYVLQVPDTADYDLYIDSPIYGTAPWNEIGSDAHVVGSDEWIGKFMAFEGGYVAFGDYGSVIQASFGGIPPTPAPDTLILRVWNQTGFGSFNLTATRTAIPPCEFGVTASYEYGLIPFFNVYTINQKPGYMYKLTWGYNSTLIPGTNPFFISATQLRDRPEYMFIGTHAPQYYAMPTAGLIDLMLPNVIQLNNRTAHLDFYSSAGGTAIVGFGGPAGSKTGNFTILVEEEPAAGLVLNAKASGHIELGEGALYKIHLGAGTYKVVVNRTTSSTSGSYLYGSHETPVVMFDQYGNYLPIPSFYPFSADYEMSYAYTYLNVATEGDYYIWVHEWAPLSFSETDYILWVEPLPTASPPSEVFVPIVAGIGIGVALGAIVTYLLVSKKGKK